jgi:hypothetical protein
MVISLSTVPFPAWMSERAVVFTTNRKVNYRVSRHFVQWPSVSAIPTSYQVVEPYRGYCSGPDWSEQIGRSAFPGKRSARRSCCAQDWRLACIYWGCCCLFVTYLVYRGAYMQEYMGRWAATPGLVMWWHRVGPT